MFFRTKSNGKRTYLQLVQSKRSGSKVRQQVIATLGRLDKLQASGALDRLLSSGARLSEYTAVLSAHDKARQGHPDRTATRVIGPALVFERLWRLTGCRRAVRHALRHRRFRFDVERAPFLARLARFEGTARQRSKLGLGDGTQLYYTCMRRCAPTGRADGEPGRQGHSGPSPE